MKKIVISNIFFMLISMAVWIYRPSGPDLIWNMFLALVALDLAFLTTVLSSTWLRYLTTLGWLFFYPNTFYMLTDIVHMSFVGSVLWDSSSMRLFMLYISSILFGVMSGAVSLRQIFMSFRVKAYSLRLAIILGLSVLSSFAIHIGRYARLNSWDIVTRPTIVVKELLNVLSQESLLFILGFTFVQILVLFFMENE